MRDLMDKLKHIAIFISLVGSGLVVSFLGAKFWHWVYWQVL